MLRYIPAAPYVHSTVQGILSKSVVQSGARQKIYQKFSSELLLIPLKIIIVPYNSMHIHDIVGHNNSAISYCYISYCLWFYTPIV